MILREVGNPPLQYDDHELFRIPNVYEKERLKALLDGLGMPRQTVHTIYLYFEAMARLYGVVPLYTAFEIIDAQNQGMISLGQFYFFCEMVRHEEHSYLLLGKGDLYGDGGSEEGLNRELVRKDLVTSDLEDYRKMVQAHEGKPCCGLPKNIFLSYSDPRYYEPTAASRDMLNYLLSHPGINRKQAGTAVYRFQQFCEADVSSFDRVSNILKPDQISFTAKADLDAFVNLFKQMKNTTRMAFNFGFTPQEMLAVMSDKEAYLGDDTGEFSDESTEQDPLKQPDVVQDGKVDGESKKKKKNVLPFHL